MEASLLATPLVAEGRSKAWRGRQLVSLLVISAVGFAMWSGADAFVGGTTMERPAGRYLVVDTLPEGLTCMQNGFTHQGFKSGRGARKEPGFLIKKNDVGDGPLEEPPEWEKYKNRVWNPYPSWRGEKTFAPTKKMMADCNRQWYHFNAEGKVLGHLATEIAQYLKGKYSPFYDPQQDVGHFVVVTNCEKVMVTRKKYHYKLYFRNLSNRPGHLKVERFKDLQRRFPERIIMRAVWGMMKSTNMNKRIFRERLKLFTGPNHLYYDKEPIDLTHHITTCTPEMSLPKREKYKHKYEKLIPAALEKTRIIQERKSKMQLNIFKKFLTAQLEEEGPEAAERMTLEELMDKAERLRYQRVFEETKDAEIEKQPPKYWPGTKIERVPTLGNKGSIMGNPRVKASR